MIPRKWPAPGQGQALRISKETARGLSIAAYFWPADAGFHFVWVILNAGPARLTVTVNDTFRFAKSPLSANPLKTRKPHFQGAESMPDLVPLRRNDRLSH